MLEGFRARSLLSSGVRTLARARPPLEAPDLDNRFAALLAGESSSSGMMSITGRRIYLTSADLDALRESLDYSIRNVEGWWSRHGEPETAEVGRAKVASLRRLRDRLRAETASKG